MSPAPIKTVSGNIRNILVAYCTTLPARRDQDIRIKCYHRKSGPVPASLLSLLKDKHCVICFACYTALRRWLSWEMRGSCDGVFNRNFKIWNVSKSLSLHMLMWPVARAVSGRVGCPHKVSGRGVCSYLWALIWYWDHLKNFIAEIPQGPLGMSIGTIWVTQKRSQGPPARGFWFF